MVAQLTNQISWDETTRSYVLPNGRKLTWEQVLQIIQSERAYHSRRMEQVTQQLLDGELTLEEWQRAMAQEMKDSHLAIATFAWGGIAALLR